MMHDPFLLGHAGLLPVAALPPAEAGCGSSFFGFGLRTETACATEEELFDSQGTSWK